MVVRCGLCDILWYTETGNLWLDGRGIVWPNYFRLMGNLFTTPCWHGTFFGSNHASPMSLGHGTIFRVSLSSFPEIIVLGRVGRSTTEDNHEITSYPYRKWRL